MANKKISEFTAATTVLDADVYVLERAGVTYKITGANLKSQIVGSSAMTQLYDNTASGAIASWDVSSISQAYNHLKIVLQGRGDAALASINPFMRMNNDTAGNYDYVYAYFNNGSPATGSLVAQTACSIGITAAASATANYAGIVVGDIINYTGTTFYKEIVSHSGSGLGTASADQYLFHNHNLWRSTSAINRITLYPSAGNFIAGSRLTIYGLL